MVMNSSFAPDWKIFSTIQNPVERWKNFLDWIDQYRRLKTFDTVTDEDIEKYRKLALVHGRLEDHGER